MLFFFVVFFKYEDLAANRQTASVRACVCVGLDLFLNLHSSSEGFLAVPRAIKKGLLPGESAGAKHSDVCSQAVVGCFIFSIRFPAVAAITGADTDRGKA